MHNIECLISQIFLCRIILHRVLSDVFFRMVKMRLMKYQTEEV